MQSFWPLKRYSSNHRSEAPRNRSCNSVCRCRVPLFGGLLGFASEVFLEETVETLVFCDFSPILSLGKVIGQDFCGKTLFVEKPTSSLYSIFTFLLRILFCLDQQDVSYPSSHSRHKPSEVFRVWKTHNPSLQGRHIPPAKSDNKKAFMKTSCESHR